MLFGSPIPGIDEANLTPGLVVARQSDTPHYPRFGGTVDSFGTARYPYSGGDIQYVAMDTYKKGL